MRDDDKNGYRAIILYYHYPIPVIRNVGCRLMDDGCYGSREWLVGVGCQHRTKFEIRGWMIGVSGSIYPNRL